MIVVDANVAVKWLLPESGHEAAKSLIRKGERLLAPSLIRFEVAGALLRRYRTNELSESAARDVCAEWRRMLDEGAVELVPSAELFEPALQLGFRLRHALADCVYLAAAETLGAELITADLTLYERARGAHRVTLLSGQQ